MKHQANLRRPAPLIGALGQTAAGAEVLFAAGGLLRLDWLAAVAALKFMTLGAAVSAIGPNMALAEAAAGPVERAACTGGGEVSHDLF